VFVKKKKKKPVKVRCWRTFVEDVENDKFKLFSKNDIIGLNDDEFELNEEIMD
jgi:hypothetical protein